MVLQKLLSSSKLVDPLDALMKYGYGLSKAVQGCTVGDGVGAGVTGVFVPVAVAVGMAVGEPGPGGGVFVPGVVVADAMMGSVVAEPAGVGCPEDGVALA